MMHLLDGIVGMRSNLNFSESCNEISAVLHELLEERKLKWAYGCAAHFFNNLALDVGKLVYISKVTKSALFVTNPF